MTVALLWLGAGAAGAAVTWWVARALIPRAPLRRPNYRGIELPAAAGVAVVFGILGGAGLVASLHALFGSSDRLGDAAAVSPVFVLGAVGFGFLGLWDDIAPTDEHGWRTHLRALGHGKPSAGALKAAGGLALGIVIVSARSGGFWWTLADGAIVALAANLVNLLDMRPGRALKGAVVAIIPMLAVGGPAAPILAASVGAAAAFAPLDLRERAMLGDAGANALGAVIGLGIVVLGSDVSRLGALAALVAVHVLAERPGLSRAIEAIAPLRRADRAGRVPG